ncbi:hypothetical protein JYJ95_03060 [Corallococcus exiguus]|uniref:hypothetical protein n=1 Tax=Corallococcus exiguus TaxID=83462 RepID=UPI001A8DAAB1|nr:hypothetical protein [Corallococcus exiguus]MBN8465472.1 hypothetical protein [Corallococcus exiguus]
MSSETKPGLEGQLALDGVQRLSAEAGSNHASLTPGAVRRRALGLLAKGTGLVLLGAVIIGVLVWLGMDGNGVLPQLLAIPTFFLGAAWFISGLTGLLTGRPWDRTPFWVKLPMMIVGAFLAFAALIVIASFGMSALRSTLDSTPDVQVGPGE